VKEFLQRKGVAFRERNIRQDPTAIEELRQLGAMATPVVAVDGQAVIGFDEAKINELIGQVSQT